MGVEETLQEIQRDLAGVKLQQAVGINLTRSTAELLNAHIAKHGTQTEALVKIQADLEKLQPLVFGIKTGGWVAKHWKPVGTALVSIAAFFGWKQVT